MHGGNHRPDAAGLPSRQRKLAEVVRELTREELRKAKDQGEPAETAGTKVARRWNKAS